MSPFQRGTIAAEPEIHQSHHRIRGLRSGPNEHTSTVREDGMQARWFGSRAGPCDVLTRVEQKSSARTLRLPLQCLPNAVRDSPHRIELGSGQQRAQVQGGIECGWRIRTPPEAWMRNSQAHPINRRQTRYSDAYQSSCDQICGIVIPEIQQRKTDHNDGVTKS